MDEELRATLRLARSGLLTARHLCDAFRLHGSIAAVLDACTRAGVSRRLAAACEAHLEADLRWLERSGAQLLPASSPAYPPRLGAIADAPAVLYVRGDLAALARTQLAIVGARAATPGGRALAHDLAAELVQHGLAVTSGLALGIDAGAHQGALAAGGPTLAVCGHGLDRVYPSGHADLARRILECGAMLSELPPGTPPRPVHFARRNRIVSGLAEGVIVVEARARSGALSTARFARAQGRVVLAVPGSPRNPLAAGCHGLLRKGAVLCERADDALRAIDFKSKKQGLTRVIGAGAGAAASAPRLDKPYEMLLDALGFEPASIDTLVERTGLSSASLASMLLMLELEGRVAPHPGGCYHRLS